MQKEGKGKYCENDILIQEGYFKNDKFITGTETIKFNNKILIIQGDKSDISYVMVQCFENEKLIYIYKGQLQNMKFQGQGELIYPDKFTYTGTFINNIFISGIMQDISNKIKYEGEFIDKKLVNGKIYSQNTEIQINKNYLNVISQQFLFQMENQKIFYQNLRNIQIQNFVLHQILFSFEEKIEQEQNLIKMLKVLNQNDIIERINYLQNEFKTYQNFYQNLISLRQNLAQKFDIDKIQSLKIQDNNAILDIQNIKLQFQCDQLYQLNAKNDIQEYFLFIQDFLQNTLNKINQNTKLIYKIEFIDGNIEFKQDQIKISFNDEIPIYVKIDNNDVKILIGQDNIIYIKEKQNIIQNQKYKIEFNQENLKLYENEILILNYEKEQQLNLKNKLYVFDQNNTLIQQVINGKQFFCGEKQQKQILNEKINQIEQKIQNQIKNQIEVNNQIYEFIQSLKFIINDNKIYTSENKNFVIQDFKGNLDNFLMYSDQQLIEYKNYNKFYIKTLKFSIRSDQQKLMIKYINDSDQNQIYDIKNNICFIGVFDDNQLYYGEINIKNKIFNGYVQISQKCEQKCTIQQLKDKVGNYITFFNKTIEQSHRNKDIIEKILFESQAMFQIDQIKYDIDNLIKSINQFKFINNYYSLTNGNIKSENYEYKIDNEKQQLNINEYNINILIKQNQQNEIQYIQIDNNDMKILINNQIQIEKQDEKIILQQNQININSRDIQIQISQDQNIIYYKFDNQILNYDIQIQDQKILGQFNRQNIKYYGNFNENLQPEQQGELTTDLFVYNGLFKNYQFQGYGELKCNNGIQIKGMFDQNMLNGSDIQITKNLDTFIGQIEQNIIVDGQFIFNIDNQQNKFIGTYKNLDILKNVMDLPENESLYKIIQPNEGLLQNEQYQFKGFINIQSQDKLIQGNLKFNDIQKIKLNQYEIQTDEVEIQKDFILFKISEQNTIQIQKQNIEIHFIGLQVQFKIKQIQNQKLLQNQLEFQQNSVEINSFIQNVFKLQIFNIQVKENYYEITDEQIKIQYKIQDQSGQIYSGSEKYTFYINTQNKTIKLNIYNQQVEGQFISQYIFDTTITTQQNIIKLQFNIISKQISGIYKIIESPTITHLVTLYNQLIQSYPLTPLQIESYSNFIESFKKHIQTQIFNIQTSEVQIFYKNSSFEIQLTLKFLYQIQNLKKIQLNLISSEIISNFNMRIQIGNKMKLNWEFERLEIDVQGNSEFQSENFYFKGKMNLNEFHFKNPRKSFISGLLKDLKTGISYTGEFQ